MKGCTPLKWDPAKGCWFLESLVELPPSALRRFADAAHRRYVDRVRSMPAGHTERRAEGARRAELLAAALIEQRRPGPMPRGDVLLFQAAHHVPARVYSQGGIS